MATKNTLKNDFFAQNCKPAARGLGRPKGSKDKVSRSRSASATVYRIARMGKDGNMEYVDGFYQYTDLFRHLNKLVPSAVSAQSYAYKGAAEKVCAEVNRIMKKEKHKKGDFFVEASPVLF